MYKSCEHCTGDNYQIMLSLFDEVFDVDAQYCPYCGRYLRKNNYHLSEPPEIIKKDNSVLGDIEERHPAYAQMSFSRQSGGYSNLFGSAIKHQETIVLSIHPSVKLTSEYSEKYFSRNMPYIEVRMSQSQFAQAITSMNMGSGVPVTLEGLRGKVLPKCEERTVSEIANDGLAQKMKKFADKISKGEFRVNEILSKKGNIKVGERKEIKNIYSMLMQDLRSNIPFLHTCMIEAYDKTAQSTKADIEAFYSNAIMRMGLEVLEEKKRIGIDDDVIDVVEEICYDK